MYSTDLQTVQAISNLLQMFVAYLFIIKSYTEYNKHIKEKVKTNAEKNTEKKLKNKKYTNSYKAHNKTLIRHCNKINKII